MKIEECLTKKKEELEELQKDIDVLETQALILKEQVKKYNELKSKSAQLKKTQKRLRREFDTVVNFIKSTDESYLDGFFPLFANPNPDSTSLPQIPTSTAKEARA